MTEDEEMSAAGYRFECPICNEVVIHEGDLSGDCINCSREFDREKTVDELILREKVLRKVRDKMDEAHQNHASDKEIGRFKELIEELGGDSA